jgi:hypothetical protein
MAWAAISADPQFLIGEKPYDADPLIDTFNRRP